MISRVSIDVINSNKNKESLNKLDNYTTSLMLTFVKFSMN